MNFRTHNEGPINTHMTQLQGYIQGTLLEMTRAFGKPRAGADGSFFYWQVLWPDGVVATIYDWGQPQAPEVNDVIGWHVGGHDRATAERLHAAFRFAQPMQQAA